MADISTPLQGLAERYEAVCSRIRWAAERAGRDPQEITVVAITKTWPAEVIVAAYEELGLRHFGENRARELAEKRAEVESKLGADSGIVWHLVGPLQSRKTKIAADTTDYFHALDRLKIARRLSKRLQETGKVLPVLLEVNVSGEASKHGFEAARWETDADHRKQLAETARKIVDRPNLDVQGLMTMAPLDAEDSVVRSVFRRTHALAAWLQEVVPEADWSVLSMGMTDDFEMAVEQGATHVRIGRAIFGPRDY